MDMFVIAYIGPDQILPLTSTLGAIVGVVLMFWTKLLGLVHRVRGAVRRSPTHQQPNEPVV